MRARATLSGILGEEGEGQVWYLKNEYESESGQVTTLRESRIMNYD